MHGSGSENDGERQTGSYRYRSAFDTAGESNSEVQSVSIDPQ